MLTRQTQRPATLRAHWQCSGGDSGRTWSFQGFGFKMEHFAPTGTRLHTVPSFQREGCSGSSGSSLY